MTWIVIYTPTNSFTYSYKTNLCGIKELADLKYHVIKIIFLFTVFIFQPILLESLYQYWNDWNPNSVFGLKKYKKRK